MDKATLLAMNDTIILSVAAIFFSSHQEKAHEGKVVKLIQDAARLLDLVTKDPDIKCFSDCFKPSKIDIVLEAIKQLGNFDQYSGLFGFIGLPARLFHVLKEGAKRFLYNAVSDGSISNERRETTRNEVNDFLDSLEQKWKNEINPLLRKSKRVKNVTVSKKVDSDVEPMQMDQLLTNDQCDIGLQLECTDVSTQEGHSEQVDEASHNNESVEAVQDAGSKQDQSAQSNQVMQQSDKPIQDNNSLISEQVTQCSGSKTDESVHQDQSEVVHEEMQNEPNHNDPPIHDCSTQNDESPVEEGEEQPDQSKKDNTNNENDATQVEQLTPTKTDILEHNESFQTDDSKPETDQTHNTTSSASLMEDLDKDDGDETNTTEKKRDYMERKRWSVQEKNVVLEHFGSYIKNENRPGKQKCLELIKREPVLSGRSWAQVNTYIDNYIKGKTKLPLKYAHLKN